MHSVLFLYLLVIGSTRFFCFEVLLCVVVVVVCCMFVFFFVCSVYCVFFGARLLLRRACP